MTDKRSDKRSPIELAASYGIGDDPRPEREVKINNISSGGICLTMNRKMNPGDKIQLSVELEQGNDVVVLVKVVWVEPSQSDGRYVTGVQIIEKQNPEYERFLGFYNQQS